MNARGVPQSDTYIDVHPCFDEGHVVLPSLPVAVMVRFDDFTSGCIEEDPGVVAITPRTQRWRFRTSELDFASGKKRSVVYSVSRKQLPLAPAETLTTHNSQGKTLPGGVILDCAKPPTMNDDEHGRMCMFSSVVPIAWTMCCFGGSRHGIFFVVGPQHTSRMKSKG